MRAAMGWHTALWGVVGAAVAVSYLSLRASDGRLLASPEMFEGQVRRATVEAPGTQAFTDALTGLPNRAACERRVDEVRPVREAAVRFLELDRFKLVNDSSDHRRGDELLFLAGRRLPASLRHDDELFRIGWGRARRPVRPGGGRDSSLGLADRWPGAACGASAARDTGDAPA